MQELLTLDCPHCGTKSVAFTVQCKHLVKTLPRSGMQDPTMNEIYLTCNICNEGVIATIIDQEIHRVVPNASIATPPHLPENVKRFFEQGTCNLGENWDAAGSMFRKALDISLIEKFPKIKGSLFERIKDAESQKLLTPELAEWADQIRLEGNAAVHDDEPFLKEQANDLANFTDLVLRYVFTLPQMLKQARDSAETHPKEIDGD